MTATDTLSVTVSLDGECYPSTNQEGADNRRDGRKAPAYLHVFKAIKTAAEQEMQKTGWTTAECECLCVVTLIVPNHRRRDALNIGTAEANALTQARVWSDDTLANPTIKQIVVDPGSTPRVNVTVIKTHQRLNEFLEAKPLPAKKPRRARKPRKVASPAVSTEKPLAVDVVRPATHIVNGIDIPPGHALVNGKLVPISEARALLAEWQKRR